MCSEPRVCVILRRHSMTALKEDTSLSSEFGPFYPLLSPQIKTILIATILVIIQMWTF